MTGRHAIANHPRRWAPAIISSALFAAIGAVAGFSLSATGAVTGSPNETCPLHVVNGIVDQNLVCTPDSTAPATTPPKSSPTRTVPPTHTPSPTPTKTQVPPPTTPPPTITESPTQLPTGGFPDASSTGVPAGTALRACSVTITQPGTYSGCDWTSGVSVQAKNVTIKNSVITASGEQFGIDMVEADNLVVDHVTITSPSSSGSGRLLAGIHDHNGDTVNPSVIACDISHVATGVQFNNGLIQDSYIHDLAMASGDHVNGTTSNAGSHSASEPLVIRHNTVLNPISQTDAVSLFEDFGGQDYATITDNLLAGGGYAIYGGQNTGGKTTTHIVISNNQISTRYFKQGGSYGPVAAWNKNGAGNSFTGNIWADGPNAGNPVPEPQGF